MFSYKDIIRYRVPRVMNTYEKKEERAGCHAQERRVQLETGHECRHRYCGVGHKGHYKVEQSVFELG